jgi:hypothetical protein
VSPRVKYVRKSVGIRHPNLPYHSSLAELRFENLSELYTFLALEMLRNATKLELFYDDLSTYEYLEIFEMLPVLQELVIWVGGECNCVRALLSGIQDYQEGAGGRTSPSCVPLRSLSYLRIIEADLRVIEGDPRSPNEAVILNLVRQRKLIGLGLLRLELVCCQYVSLDWVEALRQFVPEVLWDGRDGVGEAHLDDSDEDYCPSSSDPGDLESDDSSWESCDSGEEDSITAEDDSATSESTDQWILGVSLE